MYVDNINLNAEKFIKFIKFRKNKSSPAKFELFLAYYYN